MSVRAQITLDAATQRRARARAAELGVSFAEYVRRLVASDLGEPRPKADVAVLFDLVDEGQSTDIARDKDAMIEEAVSKEHVRRGDREASRKRSVTTGS